MTILITSGTGKTGRRIAARLSAHGIAHLVGSRAGDPPFDWQDRSTWRPAMTGADAAWLAFAPDLASPGAVDTVGEFADVAVGAGVRRLVLLSGRGEESAQKAEERVAGAGVEWTVVRASFFMQNFSESVFRDALLSGELTMPDGNAAEPFVDAEDIADVAVAALTRDGHAGATYEVTGPELLSFGEAVEEIARVTGRPMRYQPVTVREYAAGMVAAGVPQPDAEGMAALFSEVLDGRNARVGDGIQRALGREPAACGGYVRAAAAAGAWS